MKGGVNRHDQQDGRNDERSSTLSQDRQGFYQRRASRIFRIVINLQFHPNWVARDFRLSTVSGATRFSDGIMVFLPVDIVTVLDHRLVISDLRAAPACAG